MGAPLTALQQEANGWSLWGRVLLVPLQAGNLLSGPFRLWAGLALRLAIWLRDSRAPLLPAKPALTLGTWSGQHESMGGGRVELELELELELETKGAW